MKRHLLSYGLSVIAAVAVLLMVSLSAAAQSKPTPRTADGHPDLSGMWVERLPGDPVTPAPKADTATEKKTSPAAAASRYPSDALPYQPWAAKKARELHDAATTDPLLHCLPYGEPRIWGGPHPARIIQMPGDIVILYERDTTYRVIPTDGTQHPKDPDPSYMGDSVGRWEGDTLVVDVIGLNDKSWLGSGKNAGEGAGTFHSDALHVTERISRPDFDHLSVQITDDDPKVFAKPWTYGWNMRLVPNEHFYEDVTCSNEKDLAHEVPEKSAQK
jgi:hypothetical protein